MKLGVISLGCDKATVDSERVVGELVGHGAVVTGDLPSADVILINTCGFIDAAKQESIDAILGAARLKREGDVKAVVAVGCLVERYRRELKQEIPEVDLFLGFSDLHHLVPDLAARGLIDDPVAVHPGVRQFLGDQPHVRYLKISEGCDHTCAFCAIPLMRGKHRSEPLERLVREAQLLEAEGAQEINLVAQDLGHYGRDLGRAGPKLPELLAALLGATTVPWYRLLYVYSAGLTDQLVQLVAREPRVVPYLDMPIQHAADRLLERMRRPERQDTLRAKLTWLRSTIPDLARRSTGWAPSRTRRSRARAPPATRTTSPMPSNATASRSCSRYSAPSRPSDSPASWGAMCRCWWTGSPSRTKRGRRTWGACRGRRTMWTG